MKTESQDFPAGSSWSPSELMARLLALEDRVSSLERKVDSSLSDVRRTLDKLSERIAGNFRWTVAVLLAHWLSFVGLIAALVLKLR